MYECLEQMLRSKDTFDFVYESTIDITHCCPEIYKFNLTFQVAKIVQRKNLDLRKEKKFSRHSKSSDFLQEINKENTKLRRIVF